MENWRIGLSQCMLSISNVSMNNNQPWANSGNFKATTVCFEVILKRLYDSYGNVVLTKNTIKCHKIMKRFSKFHNNLKNSLITASIWPYRNIILTLYIRIQKNLGGKEQISFLKSYEKSFILILIITHKVFT